MNRTIVKTREAHDFLALVPQLAGFLPENSLVLVAFRGNRTCGAMRFNLPEPDSSRSVLGRVVSSLIGTLCKIPGVDAVVPVVYSDEPIASVTGLPQERFAEVLSARARLCGFLVRDSLCVAPDGWGSYLDPDCPAGGHPLSAIAASEVNRSIPAEARLDLATLRSRADLPRVDPARKARVGRRLARYQRLGSSAQTVPELLDLAGDIIDPVATAEAALGFDSENLAVEEAAALLFLVQGPACRDQMMLQFAFGESVGRRTFALNLHYAALQRATGRSLDDLVAEECAASDVPDVPDARETSDYMLGLTDERPDPGRIERAVRLLKAVVALAPRACRPAPLCMLAWLSWAMGRGSVAGIFIDQARSIDPGYGMAELLDTVVSSGHLPDWAFAVPPDETSEK
ncbi:DUF4192 domain-containing protein [Cryobacterium sp. TMT1-21]|uniref:DUF4192 domain-containing protein n=1 Tax=Cryobacterium shii TaxID=1259235 RepID=A0AAQ2HGG6_9MICO|nr:MULTISPECIES: DUF4192 domain-containing protein [Cryobacterium]TFC50124.1 DUF4192 domain-containing protein [Cryobacterium shii]TFC82475.1 DUF4192 domain-containing protein [Cryobacterium sp. TmT2-59]TFD12178.1 DUF4192 domain-containing protein [Cryobacterium sp. TMT1-21]TFD19669.1 DUF4192 domain-containing protein [Cryobacterium sp. TMT4-10]TFD20621.1 DUF4192 domain-containing protein [Cryobacterium sp. TMT2-23]